MRKWVFLFAAFSPFCGFSQNIWLSPPEEFDTSKAISSFYADMSGGIYGTPFKGFEYVDKNVSIFVRYLDALPDELTDLEKKLFSKREVEYEGEKRRVYEYLIGIPKHKFPPKTVVQNLPDAPNYSEDTPFKKMTLGELVHFMKEKNFFFFTGAGLSAKGGVHTCISIYEEIGCSFNAPVDHFVKTALNSPEFLIGKILKFFADARDNPPTEAHEIIREIALDKGVQIATSNFDRLHHRTGILPYRTMGRNIEEDLKEEWLAKVDGIITVGLGRETRHILGAYKKYNPRGILIAINENRPKYIGPEDYLIQGDCQEILSQVGNRYFNEYIK